MKIFINLPTWLGDAVMASAALKALLEHFKDARFYLYGSFVACELFKELPNSRIIIADKKGRYKQILKLRKELGVFDYAFSFRSAFSSKIILNLIKAKKRFYFDKNKFKEEHQVLKYLYFIENALNFKANSNELWLPFSFFQTHQSEKFLGLNPGAKYGSAKRWESKYFAEVAKNFKESHEILIFGISDESEICKEIETLLLQSGARVKNLCGETSIKELCEYISKLDLFITNDSGAMHISAAFKIPMVAIFGPTKFTQTSPWQNENARIVHLNLPCMPCMKRVCPLKHHKCMQDLSPNLVINEAKKLLLS